MHKPALLDMGEGKHLQVRFTGSGYELQVLQNRVTKATVFLSATQYSHLAFDMKPVSLDGVQLFFEGRHVVIHKDGAERVRIPDVLFLRLRILADQGAGESVRLSDA